MAKLLVIIWFFTVFISLLPSVILGIDAVSSYLKAFKAKRLVFLI
jgi:hypothetical protein